VLLDDLNRQAAGHLARPVSSHAVAHDKEAQVGIGTQAILVMRPSEPNVGVSPTCDLHSPDQLDCFVLG